MKDDIATDLMASDRSVLVAPAGCGKTHTIAKAVALDPDGRQLILTHTHAGVHALREQLKRNGASARSYSIDTIAGWALRLAGSYPGVSKLPSAEPMSDGWKEVYRSAAILISMSPYRDMIRSSYSGLYVDEYQDCTLSQHSLIMSLGDIIKCRILGDPLQAIFGFDDTDKLVNWDNDIFPAFQRLSDLDTPWRWRNGNELLGEWLLQLRKALISGKPINLTGNNVPCQWFSAEDYCEKIRKCRILAGKKGSIVIIGNIANRCHSFAKSLSGRYQSMEEIYSADLFKWSDRFEQTQGIDRAEAVLQFACLSYTSVNVEYKTVLGYLKKNDLSRLRSYSKFPLTAARLADVVISNDTLLILSVLSAIQEEHTKGHLTRKELWYEMKKTLAAYATGRYSSLRQAAWHVRNRTSQLGRRVEHRTVSRTLLIKGLEFDHAVILDGDGLSARDLYVAMTRGSKSLSIFSSRDKLVPEF